MLVQVWPSGVHMRVTACSGVSTGRSSESHSGDRFPRAHKLGRWSPCIGREESPSSISIARLSPPVGIAPEKGRRSDLGREQGPVGRIMNGNRRRLHPRPHACCSHRTSRGEPHRQGDYRRQHVPAISQRDFTFLTSPPRLRRHWPEDRRCRQGKLPRVLDRLSARPTAVKCLKGV